MVHYKAKQMRDFGIALGDVVKVEPNHVAARNNIGVLAAQQQHWDAAVANLAKAAVNDTKKTSSWTTWTRPSPWAMTAPARCEAKRL